MPRKQRRKRPRRCVAFFDIVDGRLLLHDLNDVAIIFVGIFYKIQCRGKLAHIYFGLAARNGQAVDKLAVEAGKCDVSVVVNST